MARRSTVKQAGEWVRDYVSEVAVRPVSGAAEGGEAQRHLGSSQPMHCPRLSLADLPCRGLLRALYFR
jgi:hypothetical protein